VATVRRVTFTSGNGADAETAIAARFKARR
jgi:hypothetical protein